MSPSGTFGSPFPTRPKASRVDRSWSFQRVRSQSFLSWRLHLNTSLRASAGPTASAQAVRSRMAWHGTVLCDHPARPSSSQSHQRPSGITPDGSIPHLGLSKARRDRDRGHGRCNHYFVVSPLSAPTSLSARAAPVSAVRTTLRPLDTDSHHGPRTTVPRRGRAIHRQSNGIVPGAG